MLKELKFVLEKTQENETLIKIIEEKNLLDLKDEFESNKFFNDEETLIKIIEEKNLKPWHKKVINTLFDHRFIVVQKTQCVDSKKFLVNLSMAFARKEKNSNILILVDSLKTIKNFFHLFMRAIDTINIESENFCHHDVNYSDKNFILAIKDKENNISKIEVSIEPKKNIEEKYNLLFIDDATFIDNIEKKYNYIIDECLDFCDITKTQSVIVISEICNYSDCLQNGSIGNWFCSCWNNSINKCNNFIPFYVKKDTAKEETYNKFYHFTD